jgi:hypothetical protein
MESRIITTKSYFSSVHHSIVTLVSLSTHWSYRDSTGQAPPVPTPSPGHGR